jgi:ferredoxin
VIAVLRAVLARSGAIAVVSLIVAVVSGIPLLFWYVPSAHQAYASLAALTAPAQLVRSLHRYSSDLCALATTVHALRMLLGGRIGGARWLAWVTGVLSVALIWLVGWLGYWLVWDGRAHEIALGSSRLLDVLPVFAEPFSRSFLTDATVKPLLFFIVFFLHMLLPLALGVALWLHIARLARPRYLTGLLATAGLLAFLVAVSLIVPATSAAPAQMQAAPRALTVDAWFLWPLPAMERLSGGALWLAGGGLFAALLTMSWWLPHRRAAPAVIAESRCNACQQCVVDCPFGAIQLVPRSDDRPFAVTARVDPGLCVGCGICVGSCDPGGPDLPDLPLEAVRRRIDQVPAGATVVFACARAGRPPDGTVIEVPCAGWVHPLLAERALRHGARSVTVVACASPDPACREGARWTALRLSGQREPKARVPVTLVAAGPARGRAARAVGAVALGAAVAVAVVAPTAAPLATGRDRAELVVSFRSAGERGACRKVTDAENAKLPVHMRKPEICDRGRAPVRLRVTVDDQLVLERGYGATGLFGDGESVAIERVPVADGEHDVEVSIGESRASGYGHSERRRVSFHGGATRVVLFEKEAGFTWN